jgi:receptor protein-tyrosine kinase
VDLKQMTAALRAAWWLPVLGLLVGGGLALGVTLLQTPVYDSSTQLFVSTTNSAPNQAVQASQLSEQRADAYSRLITSEDVAQRVIDALDLDMSPGELGRAISASSSTVLIDVTVTDPSPRRAQSIAEALGTEFPEYVAELESRGGGEPPVQVSVTDAPGLPGEASAPNPVRNIALGLLTGLLLGVALALLRARLDQSVRDEETLSELVGAPVIGHVVKDDKVAAQHVVDRGTAGGRVGENFREIRNNLQWLNVDSPPTVIAVTSPLPDEGKTTTVINLALALVDSGRRVAVIEGDLRKPKVTQYLGLVRGVGLTNVLAGTAQVGEVVQRYDDKDLWVLAAGPKPPNPGELLASSQMLALIEKLRGEYDYVLIDVPPVLPVADVPGLAAYVDGLLLAVRYGGASPEQLRRAAEVLGRVQATTLGVIFTLVPPKAGVAYESYEAIEAPVEAGRKA